MLSIFCIPSLLLFHIALVSGDRVVMTNNGPLQGITVQRGDLVIEAFLGVPYAEPPVGRLRFRRPVPKTSWHGVYDASSQPPPCIQNVTTARYYEPVVDNMTEDCLYLNLWVPYSKKPSELKTIMVFTHGGAYNIGSGNMALYDGANLAQFGNVLVANFNYRVGVMGFFSAFIDGANGNMGIYDQLLAIRWIKDNAKSFGGDPDKIVLMGESAGSMTVSGHLTSPLTKTLFKRVILESGASPFPMLLDENARLYNNAQRIASLVGCADKQLTLKDNPNIVVECMKRLSARALSNAEGVMKENNPITFFPRVGDEYLPDACIRELRAGKFQDVEMLIGVSKEEGQFFLTATAPQYFGQYGMNRVSTISRRFAFQLIRFMYRLTEQKDEKEIAEFYINSIQNGTSDSYTNAIATSLGDYLISCASYFQAEFQSLRNPVYFYKFSRRPSSTVLADWVEATHFDELQYVFGNPLWDNFTTEEAALSQRMMARWVAFAKTGNPNIPGHIHWPQFKLGDHEYINLDDEESVHLDPFDNRCEFWRHRFEADIDDKVIATITNEIPSVNRDMTLSSNYLVVLTAIFLTFFRTLRNEVVI